MQPATSARDTSVQYSMLELSYNLATFHWENPSRHIFCPEYIIQISSPYNAHLTQPSSSLIAGYQAWQL
jgi:hypothetical protein